MAVEKKVRVEGDVSQYVEGTVININSGREMPEPVQPKQTKPLVKAQRIQLNALVRKIKEAGGEEPAQVWYAVHRTLGVGSIDEITVDGYETAERCLLDILEKHQESAACRPLVARLMALPEARRDAAAQYSQLHYGTSMFNRLERSQLQDLLNRYSIDPATCEHDCPVCRQRYELQIQRLDRRRKLQMAISAIAGAALGYLTVIFLNPG